MLAETRGDSFVPFPIFPQDFKISVLVLKSQLSQSSQEHMLFISLPETKLPLSLQQNPILTFSALGGPKPPWKQGEALAMRLKIRATLK